MRDDMAKVIVERPRGGAGWDRKGRPVAWDDLPSRSGFRAKGERKRTKWLNENLAPLRRYLESQVGRPWDKVYAEIRAHLSPRNAVQMHIHQHLADFVVRDVTLVDGVPHGQRSGHGILRPIHDAHRGLLFVCPRTGLLRRVARKTRSREGGPRL